MQPEPEPIDLSVLDMKDLETAVARVAARGRELRRFRRAVARRGLIAFAIAAAAAALLWWSVPRRPPPAPNADVLGWANGASPEQVLNLGGSYAQ